MTDTLYYEKLDISIVELENKLSRVVSWLNAHRQEEVRRGDMQGVGLIGWLMSPVWSWLLTPVPRP